MKIILTGVTSFRNRGVEALVTSIIEQLGARLNEPEFVVLDRVPEYDASRVEARNVRFELDLTPKPLISSRPRRILLQLANTFPSLARDYQAVRAEIASADLVVATGGDVFASEYGHRSLLSHLAPLQEAQAHQVPVFFAAHSIGPFKDHRDREAFLAVARRAADISVRERMSYRYVTEELGLPTELVAHTADPAFLLNKPSGDRLEQMRTYYRLETGRPCIALTPSQAICNWMNSDYDRHFRVWCAVVSTILRELDPRIILVPHVQEISPKNDDRVLATALLRHFNYDPRLQMAAGDYSASEFKGLISLCDLVVSERMHACIAGLSSGICTVAIGYSVKAEGILCDLFEPAQVKDGLLLSLRDFLDEEVAIDRVMRAWNRRGAVQDRLRQSLPEAQRRAAETFDRIAVAVQGGRTGGSAAFNPKRWARVRARAARKRIAC